MRDYVNTEYQDGAYTDYVRARDLKLMTFRERARQIRDLASGDRLLDVGCACGFMVEAALEVGFDAYGLELSPVAIAAATDAVRPRLVEGDVNHLVAQQGEAYDVVTAFDIVEHTFSPSEFLESLRPLLRVGGLLVMSTPDTRHVLRAVMGSAWPMLQPMQHTVLFSRSSMALALRGAGFSVVKMAPAHKVLTVDYLTRQLGVHMPLISDVYQKVATAIPSGIRHGRLSVNIGEIMVFARYDPNSSRS